MTYILDMASGKEELDVETHFPKGVGEKTPQQLSVADHAYPQLQLATVWERTSAPQPDSTLPVQTLAVLLQSSED